MKTLILAHGDCDGICSAAQVKHLYTDSKVFFTHPHGILGDLKNQMTKDIEKIFILDIALDEEVWRDLIEEINRLSGDIDIVYIDHHPKPHGFEEIEKAFTYIWMKDVSTSEITFRYLYGGDKREITRVALYGAIGDYSDETPFIKKMYDLWDKRTIYFEGGIISQALESSRRNYELKRRLVEILARNDLLSNYEDIVDRAVEMTRMEEEMRKNLRNKLILTKNIAYALDVGGSVGRAAKYLMTIGGKPIGIAVEERRKLAVMSVRTYKGFIDLNKVLRRVAVRFGGSGGGHEFAAGARVPKDRFEEFIHQLDIEVSKEKILV